MTEFRGSEAKIYDPLKCGDCGGDIFTIVNVRRPDEPRAGGGGGEGAIAGVLMVRCIKCKEESTVSVSKPAVTIEGNLCGGWG